MKILMVCPSLPVPLTNGGAIRIFNLARQLALTEDVDLVALDDGTVTNADLDVLRQFCAHVYVVVPAPRSTWKNGAGIVRRLWRGDPFCTKYVDYPELKHRIAQLTASTRYDIIQFEHSHMAGLLGSAVRSRGSSAVLTLHNIVADQYYRMFKVERNAIEKVKLLMTWAPMRRWEMSMAARFDRVVTVCERDRQFLLRADPGLDVAVVPNGIDTGWNQPRPREGRRDNILIVGSMDYQPNVDAALFFHTRILPLVRRQIPQTDLTLVGKSPPGCIRRLHNPPHVRVVADPPDVRPYHGEALVSPVALRSGGGSRLKILESLALGTPVVSTRLGCEGLNVEPDRDLLMADDPPELAGKIGRIMRDPGLWLRLSQNGRKLVVDQYDWKRLAGLLLSVYRDREGRNGKDTDR